MPVLCNVSVNCNELARTGDMVDNAGAGSSHTNRVPAVLLVLIIVSGYVLALWDRWRRLRSSEQQPVVQREDTVPGYGTVAPILELPSNRQVSKPTQNIHYAVKVPSSSGEGRSGDSPNGRTTQL
ncbi:hypothetical protein FA15DRAFT_666111 [Coprinopsis marcescibilis]|uniref:Uncharacterized protein n=1 Tax=Coprinopsis marcescibilis TaxID=230819 RepID=A0A5C3L691_COPMA|nr:hypothetical protein FA15DRAFT_666111 [Coprinopsis marcescibilis]